MTPHHPTLFLFNHKHVSDQGYNKYSMIETQKANNKWIFFRSSLYRGCAYCITLTSINVLISEKEIIIPKRTSCIAIRPLHDVPQLSFDVPQLSLNLWHFWFPKYNVKIIMSTNHVKAVEQ